MKKFIGLLCVILIISCILPVAYAAANCIIIDGVTAEIPNGMGEIQERDNRTFVPLRFVSEFLKNDVWYDDEIKTATVESDSCIIFVQNGNNVLNIVSKTTFDVQSVTMDTAAYIDASEGRTYIPIRYLAEALGYTVGWNDATQTVTLDKK